MPPRDHPYLASRFVAMAHRGGVVDPEDELAENTLKAFRRAVDLGFRYLEIDVRTTADGELLVFHDASLDRVTDASGAIGERTWAELADVGVGGATEIPRLADLLEEFPDSRFNIDIKEVGAVQPLADLVRRFHAEDRICVASFSGERLRAFRRAAPDVMTAVSPAGVAWATHAFGLRRLSLGSGAALQIPLRYPRAPLPLVRPDVIRLAHATGRVVHVWTVNDEVEMHRLIDLGVDGLISDNIAGLKQVLVDRGMWEGEQ